MSHSDLSRKILVLWLVFIFVTSPALAAQEDATDRTQQVAVLLAKAREALVENRLTVPSRDNAVGYAQQVLDLMPNHPAAQQILRDVVARYGMIADSALDRAEAIRKREIENARTFRTRGERVVKRYGLSNGEVLRQIGGRIAALTGDSPTLLEREAEDQRIAQKVLSRAVQRYADKSEFELNRGRLANARRYFEIARELGQEFELTDTGFSRLEERILNAEETQRLARMVIQQQHKPVRSLRSATVFIPPSF